MPNDKRRRLEADGEYAEVIVDNDRVGGSHVCVMLKGYGDNRWDKPLHVAVHAEVSSKGYNCIRMLYPESTEGGDTTEISQAESLRALRVVISWCESQGASTIGIYGNSFGGNIALDLLTRSALTWALLVNPVFDYVQYRKRQLSPRDFDRWVTGETVHIQYSEVSRSLSSKSYAQASSQRLIERIDAVQTPVLLIQGSDDPGLQSTELERASKNSFFKIRYLEGVGHSFRPSDLTKLVELLRESISHA